MGRPKKPTPNVEKAPHRLPGSFDLGQDQFMSWEGFWEKVVALSRTFGFSQVQTPMFEDSRLFGFWSKVSCQLLNFLQTKGPSIAAAPAGIFGLARLYLPLQEQEPIKVVKWYYDMLVACWDEKNELKQNREFGFQIFGPVAPVSDAQLLNLLLRLFTEVGLSNFSLEVNNVGCVECQPNYQDQLKIYFKDKKYDLCENCLIYLEAGNPLQIFACKNLACSTTTTDAPVIVDYLCETCRAQLISVLEGLDELAISYNLNPHVIGRPWNRRTVFELRCRIADQDFVLGTGGHSDELIQSLGGAACPALGFDSTQEVILKALELAQIKFAAKHRAEVFLVPLGELAAKKSLKLFTELWNHDIIASEFSGPSSIKMQLKLAESSKASIALIIGHKEAREGTVILRDVRSGMQELFVIDRIIDEVKKRLGR